MASEITSVNKVNAKISRGYILRIPVHTDPSKTADIQHMSYETKVKIYHELILFSNPVLVYNIELIYVIDLY